MSGRADVRLIRSRGEGCGTLPPGLIVYSERGDTRMVRRVRHAQAALCLAALGATAAVTACSGDGNAQSHIEPCLIALERSANSAR
jgi:hypothetical protein